MYRKFVLHLLKDLRYTQADEVQICGKFWDTQYLNAEGIYTVISMTFPRPQGNYYF